MTTSQDIPMPVMDESPMTKLHIPRFGGYAVFDIETGPLPDEELARVKPTFEAPSNYKDPEKIRAHIEQAEARWKEQAALDAVTGRVLCIGTRLKGKTWILEDNDSEDVLIDTFWQMWRDHSKALMYVGFCCKRFDLPFLIRRSWALGVSVPSDVRDGRYWSDRVIDLAEIWQMGNPGDTISLSNLCKFLGIGEKTLDGKEFFKLWTENREQALAYVEHDLDLTERLAQVLGVLPVKAAA